MPEQWRLVDSGLVPPPESVALDEAILEAPMPGLVPDSLHFYRRSTPMTSGGYFQRIEESVDLEECRRRGIAIVRRKSGGSSIYTDQGQLIYGLVLHEQEVSKDRADTFKVICCAFPDTFFPLTSMSFIGLYLSSAPSDDSAAARAEQITLKESALSLDTS